MRTVTIAFRYKDTDYIQSKTFDANEPIGNKAFEMFDEASQMLHTNVKRMTYKRFIITGWSKWVGYCTR